MQMKPHPLLRKWLEGAGGKLAAAGAELPRRVAVAGAVAPGGCAARRRLPAYRSDALHGAAECV